MENNKIFPRKFKYTGVALEFRGIERGLFSELDVNIDRNVIFSHEFLPISPWSYLETYRLYIRPIAFSVDDTRMEES